MDDWPAWLVLAWPALFVLGFGLIGLAAAGERYERRRLSRRNSTAAELEQVDHAGAVSSEQRSRRRPALPMKDAHTPGAGRRAPRPASPGPHTNERTNGSRRRGTGPEL